MSFKLIARRLLTTLLNNKTRSSKPRRPLHLLHLEDRVTPSFSIGNPNVAEGDNGAGNVMNFVISQTSGGATSVDYTVTIIGDAVQGIDYQPPLSTTGTLVFAAPGSQNVGLTLIGNQILQPNRTIVVTLSNPIGDTIAVGGNSGTGTIQDDDTPVNITISAGNNQSAITNTAFAGPLTALVTNTAGNPVEGASVTFTAPASGASLTPTPITITTTSGGIASSGTLTANSTSGSYSVTAETQGSSLLTTGFSLTNDLAPIASINSPSVAEGDNGTTATLLFTVTLTGNATGTSKVNYAVTGGSAVSGTDFQPLASGTLTFAVSPGPQTLTIPVTVNGNQLLQANRTIVITLSNPVGATIGSGTGTGTITDDDAPNSISLTSGNTQSAGIGQAFTSPITATVLNAANRPVQGASVTFTAPASGASFTPTPITVTTNASGVATTGTLTANATAGANYSVAIAATGGTTPSTSATLSNTVPSVSITSPTINEGDNGASPTLTFTVTLSGSSTVATSKVDYAITGGSAISGTDFQPLASGTLTFSPGSGQTRTLNLAIIGNQVLQSNRTVIITLSNGQNLTISNSTGAGTITDDDTPASVVTSGGDNQSAIINSAFANPLTAIVTNTAGNPVQGASVTLTAPASGASLTPTPVTVTTNSGGIASSGVLTANGNASAGAYVVAATTQGSSTLTTNFNLNNVVAPILTVDNPSIAEGDTGSSSTMLITVTLTGNSPTAATVNYSITGGTAVSGVDFQPLANGTLTFPAGAGPQTRTIPITLIGNQLLQSDRTIVLTLSTPTGATINSGTSTGTIVDDDAPVNFTISGGNNQTAATGVAFSSPLTAFVTNLAGNPVQGASVTFSAPGSGSSITPSPITAVTNASGVASTGSITANTTAGTYTVGAALSGLSSLAYTLTNSVGVSINDVTQNEGNTGSSVFSFTVTLSSASSQTVSVNFATSNGTAIAGTDYTATSGTLTFAPGETSRTIDVTVFGNTATESNKTFFVTLTGQTNSILARSLGTAVILNDDSSTTSPPTTIPPLPTGTRLVASAVSSGNQPITILDTLTGITTTIPNPLAGFNGPISLAMGDVNGDGRLDLVVAAGFGGQPRVVVIDGATGNTLIDFFAYDMSFTGGVNVVLADLTGDGRADIVTGAGAGGGANVRVFDGATFAKIVDVLMFPEGFHGGVSVAVGDVNGDGFLDIVTGAGAGGGPHVKAFDPRNLQIVSDFFAFAISFSGGVNVAAGDLNGDGVAEIIAGAGGGGTPEVRVFRGTDNFLLTRFQVFEPEFKGGVQVKVNFVPGVSNRVILCAAGFGGGPRVRGYDFTTGQFVYDTFLGDPNSEAGATVS